MNPHRLGTLGTLLAASLLAIAAGGCGTESAAQADMGPVFAIDRDVTSAIEEPNPDRTDVLTAADLRILLNQIISEHSGLAVQVMRAAANGRSDVHAAIASLQANTDEFTRAIGLVYGPTGARAFDQLWTQHIEFFVEYGEATGHGDDEAASEAHDQLGDYALDFSSFATTATGGAAGLDAVLALLHEHVHQLIAQADAWVAGDFADAYSLMAQAQVHADVIATALAGAIASQQPLAFPGEVDGEAVASRAHLHTSLSALPRIYASMLLAERSSAPDAEAARAALADATADLVQVTGAEAWEALTSAWSSGNGTAVSAAVDALTSQLGAPSRDLLESLADGGQRLVTALPDDVDTAQDALARLDDDTHALAELLASAG